MQEYVLSTATGFLARRMQAGGIHHALLTGESGTGKTSFSEWFAGEIGAKYFYALCHPWVTDEDFFHVLDVAALAVGIQDRAEAWTPGILRLAAEASWHGRAVLCLDEIDKAKPSIDVLLLDFLQTGRVPLPDHRQIQANQANLFVVLTSNGQRHLTEALARRVFRLEVPFLPEHIERDILRKNTGAPVPLIKEVQRIVSILRKAHEASSPSLTEMQMCLESLLVTLDEAECMLTVRGTLLRTAEDEEILSKALKGGWHARLYGILGHGVGVSERLVYSR